VRNTRQNEKHLLSDAVSVQRNLFKGTMNYVRDTIGRLSTDVNLIAWTEAKEDSPEYYYNALKTYKNITEESAFRSYLDYTIGITNGSANSFVITQEGTRSKEIFFRSAGIQMSDSGSPIQGIYPHYDINGDMTSASLVISRKIENQTVYFISRFNISGDFDSSCIAFHDSGRDVFFSNNQDLSSKLNDFNWNQSTETHRGYTIEVDDYYDLGFSVAFAFKTPSIIPSVIILTTVFSILAILLVILLRIMAMALYRPVEETLKEIPSDGSVYDEFDLIRKSGKQAEDLSRIQKYRQLVRGIPAKTTASDESDYFTVAVLEYFGQNPDPSFSEILESTAGNPELHFIRTEFNEVVLLFQRQDDSPEDDFIRLLRETVFTSDEDTEISIAVSGTEKGCSNVHILYEKAKNILKYKHRIKDRAILTESDISGFREGIDFSLMDENRLINRLLARSDEALEIFDNAIKTNLESDRKPGNDDIQRFSYLMIFIAMRLFQELKCSPEEILGYSISWSDLFNGKDYQKTLSEIRKILSETLKSLRERENQEGTKFIGKMKAYINEHYMENIMLIDLSNEFNLTPKYCSQLFAQFSDENYKTYLNKLRIHKACEMIAREPDIKISYLSLKTGFSNPNTFIRVFSQYMGVTPKTYAETVAKRKRR